jgi:hypothetical protein
MSSREGYPFVNDFFLAGGSSGPRTAEGCAEPMALPTGWNNGPILPVRRSIVRMRCPVPAGRLDCSSRRYQGSVSVLGADRQDTTVAYWTRGISGRVGFAIQDRFKPQHSLARTDSTTLTL